MNRKLVQFILISFFFCLMSGVAFASSLTGQEILEQFNLVVLDDATSTSHVDGRTYVGGKLTGGDYVQHPDSTPTSAYAGLTVKENASNIHVNGLGTVIDGNLTNSIINTGEAVVLGTASSNTFNNPAYVGNDGGNNNLWL